MYSQPKHAKKHHPKFTMPDGRTRGEVWHEKAMQEGFLLPLIAFAACMALVLACVIVVGGSQPMKQAHADGDGLYEVTPADVTNWQSRERMDHNSLKAQWSNAKAQLDLCKEEDARRAAEEEAALQAEQEAQYYYEPSYYSYSAPVTYSGETGSLRTSGVESDGNYIYTWYSQNILPGTGLDIPGRHVGEGGYVMDGDDNIVVASSDLARGTEVDTPYGQAKVYDTGCASGVLDVYTNW